MVTIGIVTASMSHRQTGIKEHEYNKMLVMLVYRYIGAGYDVILIPHVETPSDSIGVVRKLNDHKLAEFISVRTGAKIGTQRDIKKVSVIISARFHVCISALNNGIPVVGLAWGNKFSSLNHGINSVIPIREALYDPKRIFYAADRCIRAERPDVSELREQANEGIKELSKSVSDYYESILGKGELYLAHATDSRTRWKGASGGIATVLGCSGEDSVYHQRELAGNVGALLPCHKKQQDLTIGLFCSHAIETKGIRRLGCGYLPARYRYKHNDKTGMILGKLFIPLKIYWSRFFQYFYIPKQCRKCRDLFNKHSDISLGDAHGINGMDMGLNVVITRTEAGCSLFWAKIMGGEISAIRTHPALVLKTQAYYRVKARRYNPKIAIYMVMRSIGLFISDHDRIFAPVLNLYASNIRKKGERL